MPSATDRCFGAPRASAKPGAELAALAPEAHASVLWITSGGCDGCTMSVLGAVSPALEDLLGGGLTDIPSIELVHPVLSLESGARFLACLEAAARGDDDGFLLVVEGSLYDERLAGEGSFSGLGERDGQPIPVDEWVCRLAPQAQAVIAIGTCATSGGIPAARGSVTGAMGLGALLGQRFRSRAGVPIVNVPGCAPHGDAFIESPLPRVPRARRARPARPGRARAPALALLRADAAATGVAGRRRVARPPFRDGLLPCSRAWLDQPRRWLRHGRRQLQWLHSRRFSGPLSIIAST